jgi:hypothetical protein
MPRALLASDFAPDEGIMMLVAAAGASGRVA